jgi:hypothetical protein
MPRSTNIPIPVTPALTIPPLVAKPGSEEAIVAKVEVELLLVEVVVREVVVRELVVNGVVVVGSGT